MQVFLECQEKIYCEEGYMVKFEIWIELPRVFVYKMGNGGKKQSTLQISDLRP